MNPMKESCSYNKEPKNIDDNEKRNFQVIGFFCNIYCFYIINDVNILFILQNLSKQILPNSILILKVFIYLYKDYVGGVIKENQVDYSYSLSFFNVKYYFQKRELDLAFEKGFPSFITEELKPLKNSTQVEWLTNDKGVVDDYI